MGVNLEAAQLVVGSAIVDARYRRLLLQTRGRALRDVAQQASTPAHVRLTDDDRLALGAIRARSLAEFARGVERLRVTTRPSTAEPEVVEAEGQAG